MTHDEIDEFCAQLADHLKKDEIIGATQISFASNDKTGNYGIIVGVEGSDITVFNFDNLDLARDFATGMLKELAN